MSVGFQSIGPPPKLHADRVTTEMLRDLAKTRAKLGPAIQVALAQSKDGNPRAQHRMAERLRKAGAAHVDLTPGKRGKYTMAVHELVGWNPNTGREIGVNDPIPHHAWLAVYLTVIANRRRTLVSKLMMLMTHHAVSRCAQRFGLRTPAHIVNATCNIWIRLIVELGIDKERWYREFFPTPTHTRHVRIDAATTVVVQRYHDPGCDPEGKRKALVVKTMVPATDEEENLK